MTFNSFSLFLYTLLFVWAKFRFIYLYEYSLVLLSLQHLFWPLLNIFLLAATFAFCWDVNNAKNGLLSLASITDAVGSAQWVKMLYLKPNSREERENTYSVKVPFDFGYEHIVRYFRLHLNLCLLNKTTYF